MENNRIELTDRDFCIDILKGLGIILMVAGHCGAPFTNFIYLFHMPIFFLASGYFYKASNSEDFHSVLKFLKKKIISLWFPYVIWTTCFTLLNNFFIKVNIYTNAPIFLEYVTGQNVLTNYMSLKEIVINILLSFFLSGHTQLGGAFWFIATLFKISVLYCFVDFIFFILFKKNYFRIIAQFVFSLLLLCVGYYFSNIEIRIFSIDKVFSFYCLFYIGYIIKEFNLKRFRKNVFCICGIVISFVVFLFLSEFGTLALDRTEYLNPLFLLICSLNGWVFIISISYFFNKINILSNILIIIGRNTLPVVILHFLFFKIVNLIYTIREGLPTILIAAYPVLSHEKGWWILYLFVGLIGPIGLNLLYKKILNCYKRKEK